jgi:hypothetical protein
MVVISPSIVKMFKKKKEKHDENKSKVIELYMDSLRFFLLN